MAEYNESESLEQRVRDYIAKGGRPEYQGATEHPSTLAVYNQPLAKQNGAEYGTFEYYQTPEGTFTRDLTAVTNIKFDNSTGKISVTIPDKWQDDPEVAKIVDNSLLQQLSKNFRADNNVQYQDPYDETKKINTEKYIEEMNSGLKDRVKALEATAPTKVALMEHFGGSQKRNDVINNMSTDDIIRVSVDGTSDDEDAMMSIPQWMVTAYPQIAELGSFKDNYVKKSDFIDNFYNIEGSKITENQAGAIVSTTNRMVNEDVEDMTPDEYARTIAFYNFLAKNDPKRSGFQQFISGGSAMAQGFYSGLWSGVIDTANFLVDVANFAVNDLWGNEDANFKDNASSFLGIPKEGEFSPDSYMSQLANTTYLTNTNARNALNAGYQQGFAAEKLAEIIGETILFDGIANAITSKIIGRGATKVAEEAVDATIDAARLSKGTEVATAAQIAEANAETAAGFAKGLKAASKSTKTANFYRLTIEQAQNVFDTMTAGMGAMLNGVSGAKAVSILNSAVKVANMAKFANTAVEVLGLVVMSATINNRDLTRKVLSSDRTADDTRLWLTDTLFDAGAMLGLSALTGVGVKAVGKAIEGTKAEAVLRSVSQKASRAVTGFTNKFSKPWTKFRLWYLNKVAENARKGMSNAKVASAEAAREANLMNEARAYASTRSTTKPYTPNQQTGVIRKNVTPPSLTASPEAISATASAFGVSAGEFVEKTGVVVNGTTGVISEYEGTQADLAELENQKTDWGDVETNVSVMTNYLTNPNVEPVISQQIHEAVKADSKLLRLEESRGLLNKEEIKANKKISKEDYSVIYTMHSRESAIYAVRSWELGIIRNELVADGVDLNASKEYQEALERFNKASENLPSEIRDVIDKEVLPAFKKVEHSLATRMSKDWGIYSQEVLDGLRADPKWGTDGNDWIRTVALKDMPKGMYTPFDKTVQKDNTLGINRFKVLEDDDITWIGNGLSEMIRTSAIAKADKDFLESAIKVNSYATETVVTGETTASARKAQEYRKNLNEQINNGLRSFKEEATKSESIGKVKKKAKTSSEAKKEANEIGGITLFDSEDLKGVMGEHGVATTDTITDADSLQTFYVNSSGQAQKILEDELDIDISIEVIDSLANSQEFVEEITKYYQEYGDDFYDKMPQLLQESYDEILDNLVPDENDIYTDPITGEKFIAETADGALDRFGYRFTEEDVPVSKLNRSSRFQPRTTASGKATSDSVYQHGYQEGRVDQPMLVLEQGDGTYEVLGGHSRTEGLERRAAEGLPNPETVRARVYRGLDDKQALQVSQAANQGGQYESILDMAKSFSDARKAGIEPSVQKQNMVRGYTREDYEALHEVVSGDKRLKDLVFQGAISQEDMLSICRVARENHFPPADTRAIVLRSYDRGTFNKAKTQAVIRRLATTARNVEQAENTLSLFNMDEITEAVINQDEIVAAEKAERKAKSLENAKKKLIKNKDILTADQIKELRDEFNKAFGEFEDMQKSAPEQAASLTNRLDQANAISNDEVRNSPEVQAAAEESQRIEKEMEESINIIDDLVVEEKPQPEKSPKADKGTKTEKTEKKADKKKAPHPHKYELDEKKIAKEIDDAIDTMVDFVTSDNKAMLAVEGVAGLQGVRMSPLRTEFIVFSHLLSKEGKALFTDTVYQVAKNIVDANIPKTAVIIKGNVDSLYEKVNQAIIDKIESRFARVKRALESAGESVESPTVTELLDKYNADIMDARTSPVIVKTTNNKGEIEYKRVSPAIADIYNNRPVFTPMSTPAQIFANFGLLKRISTTNLNPRSFSKQAASDTAMAFVTTGALPGTTKLMHDEIVVRFGDDIANHFKEADPTRYENIKAIAERDNITLREAAVRESEARAEAQLPFNTINQEALRQANVNKYGNDVAIKQRRKGINQKVNDGLRKTSDVFGKPNDARERATRRNAGQRAYLSALEKGYNPEQAESFRRHAMDNATTNFRQKHTVFNNLRISTPYVTSGISGAKSFWKMFELDPVGVTSRIFTGFIIPIIYFFGEIMSDDELKKKYENLAEYEKANHIVVAAGGELLLIPVGEELGGITNIVTHAVEALHNENQYSFWNLMLNDVVNLLPVGDLTGFTDPEMLEPISGEAPSFLEAMDNGVSTLLSSTMPPILQSVYMATSGRDLYTGKKIDTGKVRLDDDGNAVIQSYSQSEFSQAMANVIGGDARVIEKVTGGIFGTTALHTLDTVTSAVQFVSSGGEQGSLTTAVDKAVSDLASPYTAHGYGSLEKRFMQEIYALQDEKNGIEHGDPNKNSYIKYNDEISKETDPKKRRNLIQKRNGLLTDYQNRVEKLVKGYRNAGGSLDRYQFSLVTGLLTFEDALRADRTFMHLNTEASDAKAQALATLYSFGITNPDAPSSLGYIYFDENGEEQLKMWTPSQMRIINDSFYEQGDIHTARMKAIIDSGDENSLKNLRTVESNAEQQYWDKYNATGKLSDAEWDAIDDLRAAYNEKVVLALRDYVDTYGPNYILSNDNVIDYLEDVIKVPSEYETVKGRYVSSEGGKLNKQSGFIESYLKEIFGVKQ